MESLTALSKTLSPSVQVPTLSTPQGLTGLATANAQGSSILANIAALGGQSIQIGLPGGPPPSLAELMASSSNNLGSSSQHSDPRQPSVQPMEGTSLHSFAHQSFDPRQSGSDPRQSSYGSDPRQSSYGDSRGQSSYGSDPRQSSYGDSRGQSSYEGDPRGQSSYGGDPRGQSSYGGDPKGQSSYGDSRGQSSYGGDPRGQSSYGRDGQSSYGGDPRGQSSYGGDSRNDRRDSHNDGGERGPRINQERAEFLRNAESQPDRYQNQQQSYNRDQGPRRNQNSQLAPGPDCAPSYHDPTIPNDSIKSKLNNLNMYSHFASIESNHFYIGNTSVFFSKRVERLA